VVPVPAVFVFKRNEEEILAFEMDNQPSAVIQRRLIRQNKIAQRRTETLEHGCQEKKGSDFARLGSKYLVNQKIDDHAVAA